MARERGGGGGATACKQGGVEAAIDECGGGEERWEVRRVLAKLGYAETPTTSVSSKPSLESRLASWGLARGPIRPTRHVLVGFM